MAAYGPTDIQKACYNGRWLVWVNMWKEDKLVSACSTFEMDAGLSVVQVAKSPNI